ncbi:spermidine/putrescine transport system permease protein [Streptoalloteichus tenebrarius]|uniref:Spermidine/putrescine transport system permease protein n=1 Tax=Streptoalloteichus tenebrarius (strain ATCC 17920 / DSM 40477 / JCM 4838 / CBS 697.72 / NBRC 16177 / NCIMB 11028 / NRRL B-12390 / A12253. 1 / ISP 5477) TaxID=1933 RepID=A0ABT1HZJ2_STRSD|nr:ABC transporter permease [Streptoalloteichus tenebrarius]MCP2260780.1 spermidine/putrescine transport system permease protein [Streptoalloteichus tenebrarius]BFF03404.1 ABC transporter permease [Streptoalloteichus tenebrarius]
MARRRVPRWLSANLLLLPTGLWLALFLLVPLALVVQYSFATRDTGPLRVVLPWTAQAYRTALDPAFLPIFGRTLAYAALTTVACLVLGFPLAWFIARHGGRHRNALLAAVLVPFWASYLARIYAWKALLDGDGLVNRLLGAVGLGREGGFLLTDGAVVLGLTYGFLPFMVLPLYVACERFDYRLVEASYDLGHGRVSTFFRVVLPGVRPGVLAGSLLVLVPSAGDFVTPKLLGGVDQSTFGSVIDDQFRGGNNWPLGSAMAVLLMALVVVVLVVRGRRGEDVL